MDEAAMRAAEVLGRRIDRSSADVSDHFVESGSLWIQPSEKHATATPLAFFDIDDEHLIILRSSSGVQIPERWGGRGQTVNALFFLAGRTDEPGRTLRLAGELAEYLNSDAGDSMVKAGYESEVKAALLPELSIEQYPLMAELATGDLIGQRIGDLTPPAGVDLEAVRRADKVLRTDDDFILQADDQLTVIGPLNSLPALDQLAATLIGTLASE